MNPVVRNASYAADQIKDTAQSARDSLVDFGVHTIKFLSTLRAQEVRALDSALQHIGLQRRSSAIRPVVLILSGAIVAGSLALILAPTSGKKLRAKILDLLGAAQDSDPVKTAVSDLQNVAKRTRAALSGSSVSGATPGNGVDAPEGPPRQP